MNKLWIRFLFKLDEWMCARLHAAYRREKLRAYRRKLEREDARKF